MDELAPLECMLPDCHWPMVPERVIWWDGTRWGFCAGHQEMWGSFFPAKARQFPHAHYRHVQ